MQPVGSSDARLFRSFQLVNEWLRYGEAKNSVLVTLNGAAIVGMHNVANIYKPSGCAITIWLWWATLCCLVSMAIGLSSFYARTNFGAFMMPHKSASNTGAIFFGQLATMSRADIITRLAPSAHHQDREYLEDMAGQVIVNSRLAWKKMKLFNAALLVTMAGPLTIFVLLYYWKFCDENP